jgi:hypothetical protein
VASQSRNRRGVARAKPHERTKLQQRHAAAIDLDREWASLVERRIVDSCHPWQRDAVEDPSRRVALLTGRGSGKTGTLRARALIKCVTRKNARCVFIALSKDNAEELLWGELKETVAQLGLTHEFTFHETKLRATCRRTGSTYRLVGADDKKQIEKLRGRAFDEVQLDEAASHDRQLVEWLIKRVVGPRLGERRGAFVLAGTPGHVPAGDFYEATRIGGDKHRPYAERENPEFANWKGWSSHWWTAQMVAELAEAAKLWPKIVANWEEALIEKETEQWSDDNAVWLREYMARWASDNTTTIYQYQAHKDGKAFNQWKPFGDTKLEGVAMLEAAIKGLPKEFDDYLYGYGQDLGAKDPYALNIVAFSPSDRQRRLWHVFSFEKRKMYAKAIATLLIGEEAVAKAMRGEVYTEVGGLYGVTGWPVAIVADLAGLGETVILELQNVYGLTIKAAEKAGKFGAVEVVNGDLTDERMYILADTPLEVQLATLQWKVDDFGQRKENKGDANHSSDSWIYIRIEVGAMFSAPPEDKPKKADEVRARTPAAKPAKVASSPKKARPGSAPAEPKAARGEFDSLLSSNDFNQLDWGNG